MRRRKKISTTDKVLNHIFRWKVAYTLFIILLIMLYPVYVIDGQKWKFVPNYNIKIPTNYEIHGIDVSHHNGDIDWDIVKTNNNDKVNLDFVVIKATEGESLKDEDYAKNYTEAKRVGFKVGAYHFYVPHVNPRTQAQNFIESVKLEAGDVVPVLDFETQGNSRRARRNLQENIETWIEIIEKHYSVKPIIYTNRFIYKTYIKGKLDEYPLWMSDYDSPKLEGYEESNLQIWQHSYKGRLKGIREDVDFNVFIGSRKQFDDICIP
jgi:lysozyme